MSKEENLAVPREVIIKRLKRVEGQVRGLQKMVSEERDCESIITQLAAVRSAVDSAGALVLSNYMALCFNVNRDDEPEAAPLNSLARVVAIWGRVKIGDSK
ncbi:metal-sensitive transcriptional regulator [Chloroflexota bacterium]